MNLLKTIEELTTENVTIELSGAIRICLSDRLNWLEFREPEYDGEIYSNWEDKCERIQDAIDQTDEIIDELKSEKVDMDYLEDCVETLKDIISDYQFWYKGLSRLKINLI